MKQLTLTVLQAGLTQQNIVFTTKDNTLYISKDQVTRESLQEILQLYNTNIYTFEEFKECFKISVI